MLVSLKLILMENCHCQPDLGILHIRLVLSEEYLYFCGFKLLLFWLGRWPCTTIYIILLCLYTTGTTSIAAADGLYYILWAYSHIPSEQFAINQPILGDSEWIYSNHDHHPGKLLQHIYNNFDSHGGVYMETALVLKCPDRFYQQNVGRFARNHTCRLGFVPTFFLL